jgi:hypothetical protein
MPLVRKTGKLAALGSSAGPEPWQACLSVRVGFGAESLCSRNWALIEPLVLVATGQARTE